MFNVYKRKLPENSPRRHVGSFEKIEDIMNKFEFTIEEIIEGLVGITENGYQIEQCPMILGDGKTQSEIAEILGDKLSKTEKLFQRGIRRLDHNGKLKKFLILVNIMRRSHDIEYTEKIKITI
jgi:hypothetical protein